MVKKKYRTIEEHTKTCGFMPVHLMFDGVDELENPNAYMKYAMNVWFTLNPDSNLFKGVKK